MDTIHIDLQVAVSAEIPEQSHFQAWAEAALASEQISSAELTIRIVDEAEMTELNGQFRQKKKPTNVLSFPAEIPDEVELDVPLLGDIIICEPVVKQEALAEAVPVAAHWAHLTIHGIFHLLGFDHMDDKEALVMEAKESAVMKMLGFDDPYAEEGNVS